MEEGDHSFKSASCKWNILYSLDRNCIYFWYKQNDFVQVRGKVCLYFTHLIVFPLHVNELEKKERIHQQYIYIFLTPVNICYHEQ